MRVTGREEASSGCYKLRKHSFYCPVSPKSSRCISHWGRAQVRCGEIQQVPRAKREAEATRLWLWTPAAAPCEVAFRQEGSGSRTSSQFHPVWPKHTFSWERGSEGTTWARAECMPACPPTPCSQGADRGAAVPRPTL